MCLLLILNLLLATAGECEARCQIIRMPPESVSVVPSALYLARCELSSETDGFDVPATRDILRPAIAHDSFIAFISLVG